MKKKVIAVVLVAVLSLGIAALGLTVGMGKNVNVDFSKIDYTKVLTAAEVKADIKSFIKNIDATHPYLTKKDVKKSIIDNYNAKKTELLAINSSMSALDLWFNIVSTLATFNDLHTNSWLANRPNSLILYSKAAFAVDVGTRLDKRNDLIVIQGDENFVRGDKIVKIGNKDAKTLLSQIMTLIPMENYSGNSFASTYIKSFDVLSYFGCEKEGDGVKFETESGKTMVLPVLTYAEFVAKVSGGRGNTNIIRQQNFTAEKLQDGSMSIKMISMTDDGSFDQMIKDVEKELSDGGKRFVVDVRGNPGGSDEYANKLLRTLGLKLSTMGFYRRYSFKSRQYRNTVAMTGNKYYEPEYVSESTKGVDLKVLIDEGSASAAMPMIAHVRYSNYGQIIGRASSQSPNFCGNSIALQMKNSNIIFSLPLTYGYYMDGDKVADNIIYPDIEIDILDKNIEKYIVWG